ncbi:MAG: tRNA guanosine(34) transglycosylase Tgt [Bacteroidales bacterium]|nr:tRNA guanosine(34) transglycosylase Tgt [Lentimicrobiaceae bacterium]MDD5694518.1 tRNA guanosine(34) transglycosylase Tgt [Bacteroidales bacterium]
MKFRITKTDASTSARGGEIQTDHGLILTPVFMPVGTAGTVKAVHMKDLREDIRAQIILGNTYHLYLRPGTAIIEAAGGLHRFNGWDRPILTDSGGYQVYSLSAQRRLKKDGVHFRSHIDGSKHLFTPETVVEIQRQIGADIMMALDECTPYPCEFGYALKSLELTHHWLDRCQAHFNETADRYGYVQALFPIVQGSVYRELRQRSATYIAEKKAPGNAIGGLSVGEPTEIMYEMTEVVCRILPQDKPRYLMGVGTPVNILESIALGIDMFDCVIPTRNGRNGMLFTWDGIINIKNEKWKDDFSPLDGKGRSFVDQTCTRAYLRHLFSAGEMLGAMIASSHNLAFYMDLVEKAREHIQDGTFANWKNSVSPNLQQRL